MVTEQNFTEFLGEREDLRLDVAGARPAALTLDGRELGELAPGDVVACVVAPRPARIVEPTTRAFHQILKAKFSLPDR